MARTLGVPVGWLKEQAEAKRIPHIKAGNRLLFNEAATLAAVSKMAAEVGLESSTA